MTKKQIGFWDNVDNELLEEFFRQKALAKFKKLKLVKQIRYN
jgi:hypothetical protein